MNFEKWWKENSVDLHDSYNKGDMEWIAQLAWNAAVVEMIKRERKTVKSCCDSPEIAWNSSYTKSICVFCGTKKP